MLRHRLDSCIHELFNTKLDMTCAGFKALSDKLILHGMWLHVLI